MFIAAGVKLLLSRSAGFTVTVLTKAQRAWFLCHFLTSRNTVLLVRRHEFSGLQMGLGYAISQWVGEAEGLQS